MDARGERIKRAALAGGKGAEAAFLELWESFYRRLMAFARSYGGLDERDGLVSDALIAAFQGLASYDPERPLAAWVYAVARNRFADEARRRSRLSDVSVGPPGGDGAWIEPESREDHAEEIVSRLSDAQLEEACRLALTKLPDEDRRVATLAFMEGLDSVEIGRIMGVAPGTVRWRLSRVRAAVTARVGGRI